MIRRATTVLALLLAIAPLGAMASTKTWTGGGGNNLWSNPANWDPGTAPVNGDDLVFGSPSTTNDIANLSLNSISVTAGSPTLSGNTVSLGAGGLTSSGATATISLNVTLTGSQTWSFAGPTCSGPNTITLNGTVTGNGDLTLREGGSGITFQLNGHINNSGKLTLDAGTFYLNTSNAFTGSLSILEDSGDFTCFATGHKEVRAYVTAAGAIPVGAPLTLSGPTHALLDLGGHSISVASLSGSGVITNGGVTVTSAPNTEIYGELDNLSFTMTGGKQTLSSYTMGYFANPNAGTNLTATVTGGTLILDYAKFTDPSTITANAATLEIAPEQYSSYVTNLALSSPATFKVNLVNSSNGNTPSTGYVIADGNVSLGNSTLQLTTQATITVPQMLIANTSANPTNGTFAGLPEGAIFTQAGQYFRITYSGGTGNDVVVTPVATPGSTTTTLSAAPNPSSFGNSVTLTATVSSSSGTPAGTVTFYDGATALGTTSLNGFGQATLTTSALSVGSHSLTATYSGSGSFLTSTSTPVTEVVKYATQTTITSSVNPSAAGQSVTFTANVHAWSGVPAGTVTFFDSSTTLGNSPLDSSGKATLTTSTLSGGSHSIIAKYNGNATYASSASDIVTQTVGSGPEVTLTATPDPAIAGQSVQLTALVTSPTSDVTVTFSDGSTVLGTATIDSDGRAMLRSSFNAGTHTITALYGATLASATLDVVTPTRRRATHH